MVKFHWVSLIVNGQYAIDYDLVDSFKNVYLNVFSNRKKDFIDFIEQKFRRKNSSSTIC